MQPEGQTSSLRNDMTVAKSSKYAEELVKHACGFHFFQKHCTRITKDGLTILQSVFVHDIAVLAATRYSVPAQVSVTGICRVAYCSRPDVQHVESNAV